MALEALMASPTKPFVHHAGHDLESLLNTILTVCHYTVGPNGKLRKDSSDDSEDGEDSSNVKLNHWFIEGDRTDLAVWKTATLEAFNTFIQPALPAYWQDFAPYLQRLINATWADKPFIEKPNTATHQGYRNILTEALNYYVQHETSPLSPYASFTPAKRQRADDTEKARGAGKRQRIGSSVSFIPRDNHYHYLQSFNESGVFVSSATDNLGK